MLPHNLVALLDAVAVGRHHLLSLMTVRMCRIADFKAAACLGCMLPHNLVALPDAVNRHLHLPQRVAHQDVATCRRNSAQLSTPWCRGQTPLANTFIFPSGTPTMTLLRRQEKADSEQTSDRRGSSTAASAHEQQNGAPPWELPTTRGGNGTRAVQSMRQLNKMHASLH